MKSGTQKLKKFLAFVMTVVMVLTVVPFGGLTFSAIAENEGYYTYTVENGEATITDCDESISGDVVIPDTLGGYPVTSIGDGAFGDCINLTSVEIPNSVTNIGDVSFFDCTSLMNVEIPNSVMSIGHSAFSGCISLTSVTIPDSVTSIGNSEFYGCTSLTSINVSEENPSYSSLDGVLFNKDKTELIQYPVGNKREEYVIPNSVTIIGFTAFVNCTNLTSVTIPDSVKSIYVGAFGCCTGLTSITIPASVTNIGDEAFGYYYEESTDELEKFDNFTIYGYTGTAAETYANKNGFRFISLGDSEHDHSFAEQISSQPTCTENGEKLFTCTQCNYSYTEIIPAAGHTDADNDGICDVCGENASEIIDSGECGDNLTWTLDSNGVFTVSGTGEMWDDPLKQFSDSPECDKELIINVVINQGATSIGDSAFSDCYSLTSITIPDSVTSIGDRAFEYCYSLTSVEIPNSVTSIGSCAFSQCISLTSVTIPNGVTSIDYAFSGCSSLTSVTIPDSVTIIGVCAFSGCSSLTSVIIPDSVTSIDNYAFSKCSSLTSVIIPDSVTIIGDRAFEYCNSLTSVTIPDRVTSIGRCAFSNCISLTRVDVSADNPDYASLDGVLFSKYKTVLIQYPIGNTRSEYAIPDSVKVINYSAFEDCSSLTSVTIPDSVTIIGDYAFLGCSSLASVTIPDSVTSIGYLALASCSSLTSVDVSADNPNYSALDGVLFNKDKTELIQYPASSTRSEYAIPDSVTSMGNWAFRDCSNLTSVTIGNGFTSIGVYAFYRCSSLTSVTIPDSVTSIDNDAFLDCPKLTSVIIPNCVTSIGSWSFGYTFKPYNHEKIPGFTIYGYTGTAAETYANENGFAFIALDEEHTHTYSDWVVTTEPTCTAEGEETRTCSVCGATETRPVEKKAHDLFHVEEASTCTVAGVSYDVCDSCGNTFNYTVLPLAAHTFGDWVTTKEATVFESGERKRTCTVCGFEETEEIERLNVAEVKDEKTGISVVYPENSYEGEVEISVTQTFDGASYHVLNAEKGNYQKALFDITTLIDGNKVQPNGSVFVKIPLPDGYSAEKTVVYYITNDGRLEKMDSRVEDGYIIFETTHFSFYAIVDETEKQPENPSENCSCACHKKGIAKLFFKIKLFFQKIFKKNKVCKCGVNHY